MFEIDVEMLDLASRFNDAGVEYALCGALALAMHGHPRATTDIDFIVPYQDLFEARRVARAAGFVIETGPFQFEKGNIHVLRLMKPSADSEDTLTVDLLTLADEMASRIEAEWAETRGKKVRVVSRDTLVYLKRKSTRPRDHVDIDRLLTNDVEDT